MMMDTKTLYILTITACTTGVILGVIQLYDPWIYTGETLKKPCGIPSEQNRGNIALGDKQFWEEWNERCRIGGPQSNEWNIMQGIMNPDS